MEIRKISVEETYPVRQVVLRPGRPPEELHFPGDENPGVLHLGAFEGPQLVGIATIFPEELPEVAPPPAWRLRGMGVLPEMQSKGVGRELLEACISETQAQAGASLWCNARHTAVPFYTKNGFTLVGDGFELPGIGLHFRMLHRFES